MWEINNKEISFWKNNKNPQELKKPKIIVNTQLTKLKMSTFKKDIKYNPILQNLKKLEQNKNFKITNLKKWDILFNEWNIDNNLYFIVNWELSIEKYTTIEHKDTKELAILKKGDFLWEWSFIRIDEEKQVNVIAKTDTKLLKIDTKNNFKNFIKQEPELWLEILIKIIDTSNIRLLESNKRLTSILKMSDQIASIEKYDMKNIFNLIDSFQKIIWVDYIIFLEKNPIMKNYTTIKYDTRYKWKMQDSIIDLWNKNLTIKDLKNNLIKLSKYNSIQSLKNWNEIIWFLIFGQNKNDFNENEIKNIKPIANSLAWVIKQKQYIQDQINKEYSENI